MSLQPKGSTYIFNILKVYYILSTMLECLDIHPHGTYIMWHPYGDRQQEKQP